MAGKRILTDEEKRLWQKITARDKPLRAARNLVSGQFEEELEAFMETPHKMSEKSVAMRGDKKKDEEQGKRHQSQINSYQKHSSLSEKSSDMSRILKSAGPSTFESGGGGTYEAGKYFADGGGSPEKFNRQELRRIGSGVYNIDARIDLHGLRQVQARRKLFAFLRRCQQEGARFVLVITGKGRGDYENRSRYDDDLRLSWEQGREQGVLKTMVPLWLCEPEFTQLVVRWSDAHARHGGQGALYVHIRRNR